MIESGVAPLIATFRPAAATAAAAPTSGFTKFILVLHSHAIATAAPLSLMRIAPAPSEPGIFMVFVPM